ncbi:MAG: hypothetical protein ABI210_11520 [Abditibacteriaceae bacterium]
MMHKKLSMLVTAALGISLATFPAYAQKGKQRPDNKPDQYQRMSMEQRFAKELNLTPAQQKKIHPILKQQGEQMRAIFKNDKLTHEQKREQSMKLFEAFPGKVNKHLDKTQQAKLKQMVERLKSSKGDRNGNGEKKHKAPPKKN